jgi:hypothetical protein
MEEKNNELSYFEKGHFHIYSFISTAILITLLIINILALSKKDTVIYSVEEEETTEILQENVSEAVIYEIREHEGKVCAFENGELIYTLNTYVFTLPEKDQKLISEGITTTDKNELYEILSEYY